jgi:hypothetical protein
MADVMFLTTFGLAGLRLAFGRPSVWMLPAPADLQAGLDIAKEVMPK